MAKRAKEPLATPDQMQADMLGRLDDAPPNNLDAEKNLLGSVIVDPRQMDNVAHVVRSEDFYSSANSVVWDTLHKLWDGGRGIDNTLLVEALLKSGKLDDVAPAGGAAYIAELAVYCPVAQHATYYAEIVRNLSMLRTMRLAMLRGFLDCSRSTGRDADATIAAAEARVYEAGERRSDERVTTISALLMEEFNRIDAGEAVGRGIDTGFPQLTNQIGGMRDGELIVLAARPGVGKTSLALNIMSAVASQARPVLFVSLEMSQVEITQRILSAESQVDSQRIKFGDLGPLHHRAIADAASRIGAWPMWIDDSASKRPSDIASLGRRTRRKHRLALLVVDYIQLVIPDERCENRQEQVASIARRLKLLARELACPVLCLAQLNREAEQGRPQLRHLRESGAIEQDADVVLFIHQERPATAERTVIVAKNRNGPTGDVSLIWQPEFTRFVSAMLAARSDEPPIHADKFFDS